MREKKNALCVCLHAHNKHTCIPAYQITHLLYTDSKLMHDFSLFLSLSLSLSCSLPHLFALFSSFLFHLTLSFSLSCSVRLAASVQVPLLTKQAVQMMLTVLSSQDSGLWNELGANWKIPVWVKRRSTYSHMASQSLTIHKSLYHTSHPIYLYCKWEDFRA